MRFNAVKRMSTLRSEYLIFGFVKNIGITTQIIPTQIILLCLKFYLSAFKIICIQNTYARKNTLPVTNIANLDSGKYYKGIFAPNPIWVPTQRRAYGVRYCGLCGTKEFKLPATIKKKFNLNEKSLYDVIFHIGTDSKHATCNAYIIDSIPNDDTKEVAMYYWELPSLQCNSRYTFCLFSKTYGLIEIGGQRKTFSALKFNEKTLEPALHWQTVDQMIQPRLYLSALMVNEDSILCCGGNPTVGKACSKTDIYNFKTKTWNLLADMNVARRRSGICTDARLKSSVYIGGGTGTNKDTLQLSAKTFEYYDFEKNKWILLSESNEKHGGYPILWIGGNPNILNVVSTSCAFERIDLRENKWTIYNVKDDKCNLEDIFGCTVSTSAKLLMYN